MTVLDFSDFSQATTRVFSNLPPLSQVNTEVFEEDASIEEVVQREEEQEGLVQEDTSSLTPSTTTTSDYSNLILTVSLYSASCCSNSTNTSSNSTSSSASPGPVQELQFRGTDSLASLLSRMYCLTERVRKGMGMDEGERFILIENTFYDDPLVDEEIGKDSMEVDEGEIDSTPSTSASTSPSTTPTTTITPSRPSDKYLIAIQKSPTCSLLPSPSLASQRSLSCTQWHSVPLQLHRPYLLVHEGGCEHHFVINSVTTSNAKETIKEGNISNITTTIPKVRRRACRVCERYTATRLLVNDKLMPENPTAICDACFEGFHGGSSASGTYDDYEVFPYYHD